MTLTALTAAVAAVPAQAADVKIFTVPGGSDYVQATIPASHGPLVHFKAYYSDDSYVHEDNIPASDNVAEIDNYTGAAPDVEGYDGCSNARQPDELFTTDTDSYGIPGGTTAPTGLHHNADLTFTPKGSGPYFLWCHYEHGPEPWIYLRFQDGTVVEIWWAVPTYFHEVLIDRAGTVTSVAVIPADE